MSSFAISISAPRSGCTPSSGPPRSRFRLNVDLFVADDGSRTDQLGDVVCYEDIVEGIKRIVAAGHVNLVETLADRIAEMCLGDARVLNCRVRVEKLQVIAEAASVGIEIERARAG